MLFALVAGSPEPANCGLATVVMWICGSYCEWNKHHEEEAGPNFCHSLLFPRSMHLPGYIQEGQETIFGYLLLGVYHRNSPGCTVPQPYSFSLCFLTQVWKFNHTRVLFQIGEGSAAIQRGRGLPDVGDGGSLITHSAGSVSTQDIVFKYVIASEPYRYTWYLKQVMASLPYIKIYFWNTDSNEIKRFLSLT